MPKLDVLPERQRTMMENWPCPEFEDTPWENMLKPLSEARVALVSTAGLHIRGDRPFTTARGGDTSYREIPSHSNPSDIIQSHTSIGFDRTTTFRDINITFPIDRLKELNDTGYIGSLSTNYYSFMGALSDVSSLIQKSGPDVASKLNNDQVDVVLLVPT
jgi:D-proline reductase (dithiol) PrdB